MGLTLIMLTAALCVASVITWVFLVFRPVGIEHPIAGGLPVVWRVAWPWLHKMAPLAISLLSWRSRKRLAALIICAGLPPGLSAGHVVAAQGLCALWGGIAGGWGTSYLLPTSTQLSLNNLREVWFGAGIASMGAALMPRIWLKRVRKRRVSRIQRELPFLLDMMTLCVESGLNLQGALQQAAQHGPAGPLRDELRYVVAEIRAGMPRFEALHACAQRVEVPGVRALIVALAQADTMGISLGPMLRLQAARRRVERFHQVEKWALQAPVKLLFPLIFCIFPCTFIVLAFPIAAQFMDTAP